MNLKPILTADNSTSFYHVTLNETYHSVHGAITESKVVFIENGLLFIDQTHIRVLEIGFGTGLNALLTLQYSQNKNIYYEGVEAFPLNDEMVQALNYTDFDELSPYKTSFHKFHTSGWNREIAINENFTLKKTLIDMLRYEAEPNTFDLIYFDAFSPNVQPQLWSSEVFQKLFASLKKGGILVTYSAKGTVKQALRSAGFVVERLNGPQGKRHVLRAQRIT